MDIRWICAVLLSATVAVAFDNVPLMDRGISTVSPHDKSHNADSCVGQCAFQFIDNLTMQLGSSKSVGLLNLNYNEFLMAFSNATFFENFCNMYHQFQFCFTQCPHGYLQELLLRSSEIVDHFCIYNFQEIKDSFGCLARLDQEASKQCLRMCTRHHDAVTSLMQNFKHLALNGDSTQAEKYLDESCEYVTCNMHCDVPTIAHMCDFDTANLVVNLTRRSFASMERMALDTGAVGRWPAKCSDIKNYQLPTPPQLPPKSTESYTVQNDLESPTSPSPQHSKSVAGHSAVTVLFICTLLAWF